jgi:hypothetical protein
MLLLRNRIILSLLLLCSSACFADDILIVMGQSYAVEKLSIKQLENIYRRKTQLNQVGERWNPINLSASDRLRAAFAQKIYQEPSEVMEAYWNTQYFQGIMPPYVVNSVEGMLRMLETTPGAIGYLLPCQLDKRVRVVLKLTVNESLADLCEKK